MRTAASGRAGLESLTRDPPDLALVDLNMDDIDGLAVLARLRADGHPLPLCLMMSAQSSVPAAVEAMRLGARDFLVKPLDPRLLIERIHDALGTTVPSGGLDPRAAWRNRHAPGIIGEHPRLLELFHVLERIAPTDCIVLIQGESGTGKELVARAVHDASPRRDGPFVPVNCAAIPETLIESELFGHARGAFSGATHDRPGRFAAAAGGTLFLDEIGEMSAAAQAKLLRVIEDGEFAPVGDSRLRRADVRILAATNRDLEAMAQSGGFRADLFYRLNQIPVSLPSLRERDEDITGLAKHFLRRAATRLDRTLDGFSPAALRRLQDHPWPGNVRELENAIERVVLLHGDGRLIEVDELPLAHIAVPPSPIEASALRRVKVELPQDGVDLRAFLADIELELVDQALTRAGGNKSQAARLLGVNRTTLVEKLRRTRRDVDESS